MKWKEIKGKLRIRDLILRKNLRRGYSISMKCYVDDECQHIDDPKVPGHR